MKSYSVYENTCVQAARRPTITTCNGSTVQATGLVLGAGGRRVMGWTRNVTALIIQKLEPHPAKLAKDKITILSMNISAVPMGHTILVESLEEGGGGGGGIKSAPPLRGCRLPRWGRQPGQPVRRGVTAGVG
jgi:hypothetical protein